MAEWMMLVVEEYEVRRRRMFRNLCYFDNSGVWDEIQRP